MTIALIAAHDPNLVIGKDGELPWYYPEDLKHFKQTTMGHPIVMGRITFEEFGEKPLPGRRNIVLSTSRTFDQVPTYKTLDKALESLEQEGVDQVFIVGGGKVYRQAMEKADLLYMTHIHKEYSGDTYFPEYRNEIGQTWVEIERDDHEEFSFITYERRA